MTDASQNKRPTLEDEYFFHLEQRQKKEMRRKAEREEETRGFMEASGIQDPDLARELADAGFDIEAFRLLFLVPLVQVAWSDGHVTSREMQLILKVASLRGFNLGSETHARLAGWLNERPTDRFFKAGLRGVKAILKGRPPAEASVDVVWYCTKVAEASGGLLGFGSRVSAEEQAVLTQLTAALESTHGAGVRQVAAELS